MTSVPTEPAPSSAASPPAAPMSRLARLLKWASLRWFRTQGWRVVGTLPETDKFIIAGAPHSSNYDFLVFVGVVEHFGITPRFLGKHTLFRWPIGGFMRAMGGVSVDRRKRANMVQQVVEKIAAADDFALVIAIEGTRSATTEWRSGYYRIAQEAGIPIVCAGPDYANKLGLLGPIIHPTGDMEADMEPAMRFFKSLCPRHPEKVRFPDGSGPDPQLQAERIAAMAASGAGGSTPVEAAP
ncbi:1-acyl-sn-glycerol-3-phosphate acyltransferase [Sphingomicrobium astaxanthinifaciens]|uniref:1-acyl-sn-glycerol-3-phosphate acyltransferase n=1 Tax=Sphingomicrobium astaxanthinifaciens TaxID=1227949 RepID=UPI001FCB8F09|nr:1-acyl-sn-glycerol-3-phosphate acyltransferase [Sphingomicrobium astaxanthinifaciens]MCJ7421248.1 1-acyl-sn-glycerol-3-phosphate acyltransferase [Sphingomicrobium astaxanthinifaciens]